MTNAPTQGLAPTHPGEILREDVFPALGKPKAEIARSLGISRQSLYEIINERQPVTAPMALRIGKLCGNGPEIWLRLQEKWDLHLAAIDLAGELADIPTLSEAAA